MSRALMALLEAQQMKRFRPKSYLWHVLVSGGNEIFNGKARLKRVIEGKTRPDEGWRKEIRSIPVEMFERDFKD